MSFPANCVSLKNQTEMRLLGAKFTIDSKGAFSIKDPKAYPSFVSVPATSNDSNLENTDKSTSVVSPQKEKNMEFDESTINRVFEKLARKIMEFYFSLYGTYMGNTKK